MTKSLYLKLKARRQKVSRDKGELELTALESAACGAVAGSISAAITSPLINGMQDAVDAINDSGGIRGANDLKAFIPGGASAIWFFEEHLDLPLEKVTVDKAGSMLGSGAIVVMDETTDLVRACHRVVRFFARESCGKCTPCREGTTWLERILQRILDQLRAETP